MNSWNGVGKDVKPEGHQAVREHVRSMLNMLREKLQAPKSSVDHTVEVDREKNRSGGIGGV